MGGCADDSSSGNGDDDGDDGGESAGASDDTAGTGGTGAGTTMGGADETAGGSESGGTGDTGGPVGAACLNTQFVNGPTPGPDYDEFEVTIGSHCEGTNNQDITDIERVVFVGDSVTVGTPPTSSADFYRAVVARELSEMFGLEAPDFQWNNANLITGMSNVKESGDFASCAEWGARNDDLIAQLEDCFEPEDFELRTLVIFTMGGNDASSITQDAIAGIEAGVLFEELEMAIAHHEMAIDWLVGDAGKFPNGVFVVNANVGEFTDYTADVLSCPSAGLAGFDDNPPNQDLLLGSLNLVNEEYMRIAEESGTDVVFWFESFCGHGFHAGDEENVCYRGPDNSTWFDATCIHPTPTGHAALAESFLNVIAE